MADEDHRPARQDRIGHGGNHQEARNRDLDAGEAERQRAADRPQDGDEGRRRQDRRGDAGCEIDLGVGCQPAMRYSGFW